MKRFMVLFGEVLLLLTTVSSRGDSADSTQLILLPGPRSVVVSGGEYVIPADGVFSFRNVREDMAHTLADHLRAFLPRNASPPTIFHADPKAIPRAQGYSLTVAADGIRISAHDEAGLFYGLMTLRQIARQSPQGKLPFVHIEDWPEFPNRGVLLDVSRDKVPEMETLYALVDRLSEWKCNQLQLYTEHAFAYRDHPIVWRDASPMTPAQARALDDYCRDRFVEFVPNQNSFGHMDRWLKHEQYKRLAEMPEGGSDLCGVDPECEKFIAGLYADLLPNFSSRHFNVCCDETWSLGKGRSKEAAEQKGVGRVYLDFLLKIHDLVASHGRTMMFWGDIIMQHPELIPELPKDVVAMEWGYEAEHPFTEHGKKFAESGIPFYVCPGTSAWNSLVGRTDNAIQNLRNAAQNGLANGAVGYLVTDWGDGGHWQPLPVSYLGYACGAAFSWSYEASQKLDIRRALDVHAFQDSAGIMGRLAYDLGNAYQKTGVTIPNSTLYYMLLQHRTEGPIAGTALEHSSTESLTVTIRLIDDIMGSLPNAKMSSPDAETVEREFRIAADLARFACRLGISRIEAGGVGTSELPAEKKKALAAELEPLIPAFRQVWLERNRSGGLKDSAGRLENLLAALKKS